MGLVFEEVWEIVGRWGEEGVLGESLRRAGQRVAFLAGLEGLGLVAPGTVGRVLGSGAPSQVLGSVFSTWLASPVLAGRGRQVLGRVCFLGEALVAGDIFEVEHGALAGRAGEGWAAGYPEGFWRELSGLDWAVGVGGLCEVVERLYDPLSTEARWEGAGEVWGWQLVNGDESGRVVVGEGGAGTGARLALQRALRSGVGWEVLSGRLRVWCGDAWGAETVRLSLGLAALEAGAHRVGIVNQMVEVGAALDGSVLFPAEGRRVEHKATFQWDSGRGTKNVHARAACLKTVCAFLNAEGGDLYIGVGDGGEVLGLAGDFSLLGDGAKEDTFEGVFREALRRGVYPNPLGHVDLRFLRVGETVVCRVSVRGRAGVTLGRWRDPKSGEAGEWVFVRDGNRTVVLRGEELEDWRSGR